MTQPTPSPVNGTAEPDRVRLLYIAGWGRSGSTLLELILATLPGVVAAGELRRLWDAGLRRNQLCSCGQRFAGCRFWSAVLARLPELADAERRRRLERQARTLGRTRRVPGLLLQRRLTATGDRREYATTLVRLYRAIRDEAGAEIVVDSSKSPAYGFLLASLPELDVRVLHLVRDSRGVAHSMRRRRLDPGDPDGQALMPRASPSKSALEWIVRNGLAAALRLSPAAYARLRYEELVRQPAATLSAALERLDLPRPAARAAELGQIELGGGHTLAGNPLRFHRGPLELRLDDAWRRAMPAGERRWVTLLTWPFRW